jgi:hypothetical protein
MGFTALIAGGIGAAGSIGSALIGANASGKAAGAQVTAQQQALAQQMALYNRGLGTQSDYFNTAKDVFGTATNALQPYATAGNGALTQLHDLLTPGTSAATLAQMPGFAFAQQYGTMAATNALSSKTGASAGPLATAISQYNNGLASGQYQNIVGNLQGLVNTGANAAGGIAGAANTFGGIAGSAGNAALGVSSNVGTATGNTIGNIGNAQATGVLGTANAYMGGATGTGNALSNAALFNAIGGGNGGSNGLYSGFSGPAYGGGNALTDAYGGNPNNPLPGLSASDYG